MKAASTSVGFKDALGVLVANGNLILDLSQAAEVTSGGGLIVPTRVVLPLNATAKIASTQIFFNDELSPSGTTYHAVLLNSGGSRVADFGNWSLSGASIDLSTMVPSSASVSYSGAVLLSPTGNQTIASGNLTLTAGDFNATAGAYRVAGVAPTGTGPLVGQTGAVIAPTSVTSGQIIQPAATALTIKDNQGGTRFSIPSGGIAQGQINNTTLTGASTANNVSVLNAQGATAPITGTAADAVIYTYSLPANTIDTTSKGVRISCAATHNSGTANPSVKININGVNVVTGSIGTAAGQSTNFEALILRTSTTAGGSKGMNTSGNALLPFSITLAGLAWTSAQTITFTFNVAATDQMTGIMFMVEQIQ